MHQQEERAGRVQVLEPVADMGTTTPERDRRRRRAPAWLCCAACLVAVVLSACGSSASVARKQSADTTSSTSSSTIGKSPDLGQPLRYAGTITISGRRTTITASYRRGPIFYSATGVPPSGALQTCEWSDPGLISKTAFMRGELTLSQTRGSAPLNLLIEPVLLVSHAGRTAINVKGHWECGLYAQVPLTLHSGESTHYEMWLLTEPPLGSHTITPSMSKSWRFEPNAFTANDFRPRKTVATSGPGARQCGGTTPFLFVYPTAQSCGGGPG